MNNINSAKWPIIISFIAGLIVAGLFYLFSKVIFVSHDVPEIQYTVQPNNYISISQIELKKISDIAAIKKSGNVVEPKCADCQWRCVISNFSERPVQFSFNMEFCDKDGFVLHKEEVNRISHPDGIELDLYQSKILLDSHQSKILFDNFYIEYDRMPKLCLCKITLNTIALMTEAEKQELKQQAEARAAAYREQQAAAKQRKYEQQRLQDEQREREREAAVEKLNLETQQRIDEIYKKADEELRATEQKENTNKQKELSKWKQLKLGMSKAEVVKILGKPVSVQDYTIKEIWKYHSLERVSFGGKVEFENGKLKSWDANVY